ncbi:MAG: hypothetical protein WBE18_01725 [Gammaproteobacteria bacterium]
MANEKLSATPFPQEDPLKDVIPRDQTQLLSPSTGEQKSKERKILIALAVISQYGGALDEMLWTPFRDVQVFGKKLFSEGFGHGHFGFSHLTMLLALIANFPSLFKIINKSSVTRLEEVLENVNPQYLIKDSHNKVIGITPEGNNELKTHFTNDLRKHELNYLFDVELVRRSTGIFKRKKWDIKYVFAENLKNFLTPGEEYGNLTLEGVINKLWNSNNADANAVATIKNIFTKIDPNYTIENVNNTNPNPLANLVPQLVKKIDKLSKEHLKELRTKLGNDSFEKLMLFSKLATLFFNIEGQPDLQLTINQSRLNYFRKLNEFSIKNAAYDTPPVIYQSANEASFNFWLAWEMFNAFNNDADSRHWSLIQQIIPLAVGFGFVVLKSVANLSNFIVKKLSLKNKIKNADEMTALDVKKNKNGNKEALVNNDLKHRQFTRFRIEELYKKENGKLQGNKAEDNNAIEIRATFPNKEKICGLLPTESSPAKNNEIKDKSAQKKVLENIDKYSFVDNEVLPRANKSFLDRLSAGFFSEVDSAQECRIILQEQIGRRNKNKENEIKENESREKVIIRKKPIRLAMPVLEVFKQGVNMAFLQWVLGALFFAVLIVVGQPTLASMVGGWFNDGLIGGLTCVGSFVLGMIGGGIYYGVKGGKKLDGARDKLTEQYDENKEQLKKLIILEAQNQKLSLLINPQKLPTMLRTDRDFRRLTTEKERKFTLFKKFVKRFAMFIGRMGSGILIFRLLPYAAIPLLGYWAAAAKIPIIAAILAACAPGVMLVAWPVTLVALAIGLAWGVVYTYKLTMEQSKIDTAKRLLDNLEVRLVAAAHEQDILLRTLTGEKCAQETIAGKIMSDYKDDSPGPAPASPDNNPDGADLNSQPPNVELNPNTTNTNNRASDNHSTLFAAKKQEQVLDTTLRRPEDKSSMGVTIGANL